MASFAVLSRIQLIEAPYLNEFIHWHLSIGFEKLYFLNTEFNNLRRIRNFVSKDFEDYVIYLSIDKSIHNCPDQYLLEFIREFVSEDFVLNIDSDEMLFLDKRRFRNVHDFQRRFDDRFYIFNWLNIPCFDLFSNSMMGFLCSSRSGMYYSDTCKSMGFVENLRGVDWHFMNGGRIGRKISPFNDGCFIAHFIVRSLTHQLLKQRYQYMGNFKDRNKACLRKFLFSELGDLKLSRYPFRLLAVLLIAKLLKQNDIKRQFQNLIGQLPLVPDSYKSNIPDQHEFLRRLVLDLAADQRVELRAELEEYLSRALKLPQKLSASLLPADLPEFVGKEPLWISMEKLYQCLEAVCG